MQTESVKQRSVTGGSTGNHRSFFTNSSSSSKSLGLGAKLMDYSYSIIFFLVYSLQVNSDCRISILSRLILIQVFFKPKGTQLFVFYFSCIKW